jgi:hypothetical protein
MGVRARTGNLSHKALATSILLPQGRNGPAFLAYPNFNIYFEWNKSFVYVTTAAYFATRLEGAAPYQTSTPDPALSNDQMEQLQRKLTQLGYDVGGIDGILGAKNTCSGPRYAEKNWACPQMHGPRVNFSISCNGLGMVGGAACR